MSRVDLFLFAHKGLRRALFTVASRLATCDFRDRGASGSASRAVHAALLFAREHAGHEHELVFPAIAANNPSLASGMQAGHQLVDGQQRRVEPLLVRMAACGDTDRVVLGRRLLGQWHTVIAAHLTQMEREEVEANRALHANLDDEQLLALQARAVASMPPRRRAAWLALVRSALSPLDRETFDHQLTAASAGGREQS